MGANVLAMAFAGVQAVGSLVSGAGGAADARLEEAQLALQQEENRLADSKEELERERQLEELLAERRAGSVLLGIDPTVGAPAVAADEAKRRTDQDLTLDRALAAARDRRFGLARRSARRRGGNSLVGGFIGAVSGVGRAGVQAGVF